MSKENYINKIKALPESLRQFIGLIIITLLVIMSFSILNGILGKGDDLVKRMKLEEERIAEEKKVSELISKLPSGILVSFDGTDHYKLSDEVYEQVCKATKLIPQRAIMGVNFLNFRAHELYTINGNKIDDIKDGFCNQIFLLPITLSMKTRMIPNSTIPIATIRIKIDGILLFIFYGTQRLG